MVRCKDISEATDSTFGITVLSTHVPSTLLAAAAAKLLQSCPTLCDPIDGSPPGSPVPGILQARTLEWVAISFSNEWKWKVKVKLLSRAWLLATPWTAAYQAPPSMGFSRQEYWSGVPSPSPPLSYWVIFNCYKWSEVKVAQSYPTLCDSMDYSLPGSSVHGILQPRILEWVAVPFFRESSQPRDRIKISCIVGRFFIVCATREAQEYPFFRGYSWPRNWTGVSCIAGGFFTSWATREAQLLYLFL